MAEHQDFPHIVAKETKGLTASGLFLVQANIVLILLFLYLAKGVLLPLVFAFFIWHLVNAFAERLTLSFPALKKKALHISILLAIVLILAIVQLGRFSAIQLLSEIPELSARWHDLLHSSRVPFFDTPASLFGDSSFELSAALQYLARGLLGLSGNILVTLLYVIFLFWEQSSFSAKLHRILVHETNLKRFSLIYSSLSEKIQTYVWVKSLISASTGFASYLILLAFGVKFAEIWALLSFILNFIPHIGSFFAVLAATAFSLVQFSHPSSSVLLLVLLTCAQILFGNVVEPRMMGQSLNLSPLVILVSLVIWSTIWGVSGAFLAVPLMVVITIILAEFSATRWVAVLLSQKGEIKKRPHSES